DPDIPVTVPSRHPKARPPGNRPTVGSAPTHADPKPKPSRPNRRRPCSWPARGDGVGEVCAAALDAVKAIGARCPAITAPVSAAPETATRSSATTVDRERAPQRLGPGGDGGSGASTLIRVTLQPYSQNLSKPFRTGHAASSRPPKRASISETHAPRLLRSPMRGNSASPTVIPRPGCRRASSPQAGP